MKHLPPFVTSICVLAALAANILAQQATAPNLPTQEIRLWDGPAPGVPENAGEEKLGADGRVRNVSIPTLTAYLPDKKLASGTAIIMCSGGGYAQLSVQRYGEGAAAEFLPRGIAVFSLKYRLAPPSKNVKKDALADGTRAMRLVRSRAAEWNIDPQRIGMIGASAGANMILNLISNSDAGSPGSADVVERKSSRPDFVGLLSAWPGGQKITDFRFDHQTPPVFMLHAEDDTTAPIAFARQLEAVLKQADVPVHPEYFADGGHVAFSFFTGKHRDWAPLFLPWLEERGFLTIKR